MEESYYRRDRKPIKFISFFRDVIISLLPVKFSPLARRLLAYSPDFIFFVHPRNKEDIYATFPFIDRLQRWLPSCLVRNVLDFSSCYIVSNVRGPQGRRGYVVSVTELPENLFASRELTNRLIQRSISFFEKISDQRTYIGLAAWWPIVSNSGLLFQKWLKPESRVKITSGHTATLASLYLSTIRLCEIKKILLKESKLLLIGVGKVGGALCDLFAGKVEKLGLVDKIPLRIQGLKSNLEKRLSSVNIEAIPVNDSNFEEIILQKIEEYDVTICTTSNTGLLVKRGEKLKNCIILDDSRPEAFPRIFSKENRAIVLEGGLMKIPGVELDSDFGFGTKESVFGCLSEAIILSIEQEKELKTNIGDVDYDNFFKMIQFCKTSKIGIGDFKCASRPVSEEELSALFSMDNQRS